MRKAFIFTICTILSVQYAGIMYSLPESYWLHYTQKPFVYRQLVPVLASFLPFNDRVSILVVVVAFCMALVALMLYVYESNWSVSGKNDAIFITVFFAVILMVSRYSNYYDIPTAFFFTLLLVLWERKKYVLSIPVFALSCINRETSVLLIPVFLITHRKVIMTIFLGAIYFIIRQVIFVSVGGASGETVYLRLFENLSIHASHPVGTVVLVLTFAIALFLFLSRFRNWHYATFIFLLSPMLIAVYLIAGYPFEIRVFVEISPMLFMGAFLIPD